MYSGHNNATKQELPQKKKDCHQFGNLNAGQKARAGRMPKTRSEKNNRENKGWQKCLALNPRAK